MLVNQLDDAISTPSMNALKCAIIICIVCPLAHDYGKSESRRLRVRRQRI